MAAADSDLVDREVLRALTGLRLEGEPDPVADVLDSFLEVMPDRLRALLQAAEMHNTDAVREIAHTIKGSAGIVGASSMATAARDVEHSANASGETLLAEVQRLTEIYTRTVPVLTSFVREGV